MAGEKYARPAWFTATSARAHVDAVLPHLWDEMKLLVNDHPDIERSDTAAYASWVRWLSRALEGGVERARTIHPQIKYEDVQLEKAQNVLGYIEATERWIEEDFNNAKFTSRYHGAPILADDIAPDILELSKTLGPLGFDIEEARKDPNFIDHDLVNPALTRLKQAALWRIRVAEKRVILAGAKRETGGWSMERQDSAAARYGTGEMAWSMVSLQQMAKARGWDRKTPNAYQLKILANIAQKLFDVKDGYSLKQLAHYLATAREIAADRGEEGAWFGD
jgi:hypothetical protein